MSVYGTSKPIRHLGYIRPCDRCGVEREWKPGRTICADCKRVLSPAEWRMWAA